MIEGIDVGVDQGTISLLDWREIRGQGKRFAIIRCVEGMGTPDARFQGNVAAASAAGLVLGAYFPLHPDLDPVKQAQDHFDACGGLGSRRGELAPWCDIELTRGKTPAEVLAATLAWCEAASKLWGRPPTVYTYRYFDHDQLGDGTLDGATLAGTSLALAAYQVSPPPAPPPWGRVAWWQDSGGKDENGVRAYRVPNGCPCDHDWFLGDEADFALAQDPTFQAPLPMQAVQ